MTINHSMTDINGPVPFVNSLLLKKSQTEIELNSYTGYIP